jgi:riboflavin transporter FmnP
LKEDRLMIGAISGIVGSVAQISFEFLAKAIGFTDRDVVDMAKIFIMYKRYPGIMSTIIGVTAQLLIGAILGIGFAYLIQKFSSNYYYVKGLGYGGMIWVLFATFGSLFKIPLFTIIPPADALSLLLGALIFGFFTSLILKYFEKKRSFIK